MIKTKFERAKDLISLYLSAPSQLVRESRKDRLRFELDKLGVSRAIDLDEPGLDTLLDALEIDQGRGEAMLALRNLLALPATPFDKLAPLFRYLDEEGRPNGMGQTTFQLLRCLDMLHGPQTVNYLWPDSHSLTYPTRLFLFTLEQCGIKFHSGEFPSGAMVELPETGGKIIFRPLQRSPAVTVSGIGAAQSWVLDHACEQLHPDWARPWLQFLDGLPDVRRPRPS